MKFDRIFMKKRGKPLIALGICRNFKILK